MPLRVEEIGIAIKQWSVRRVPTCVVVAASKEVRVPQNEITARVYFVSTQQVDFLTKVLTAYRSARIKGSAAHIVRPLVAIAQCKVMVPSKHSELIRWAKSEQGINVVDVATSEQVHETKVLVSERK